VTLIGFENILLLDFIYRCELGNPIPSFREVCLLPILLYGSIVAIYASNLSLLGV
jgi:hypothetical protein